ncbi:hypothetical protein GCM10011390_25630 [Aureimonas endophytica]|uniref:Methyltransferase domain-containing protein n=1 Tax=Aureimonas endophytica TaxID=2027858 RepID=A0A916ZMX5_9HYPH|nr:methyltransferase domain-containing protein [Aureimonas endophytica]GGE05464.1 hypothetical protein GCM10011390_25630 [Aureimonas endophytica]
MSGLRHRRLVPELLDSLPVADPAAIRSRADLVRVNILMGQARIMTGLLRQEIARPPRRILEIGAGDGRFMLGIARRMRAHWPAPELVLLDRLDLVSSHRLDAFNALGWHVSAVVADVFSYLETRRDSSFDLVIANLFLHHFDDEALRRLLALIAGVTPVLAATEPRRAPVPYLASRMLLAVGASRITRHDAPASVRAGFAGRELADLWPATRPARIEERRRGLFTHAFVATVEPRR